MAAEIVFVGGERVLVTSIDVNTLTRSGSHRQTLRSICKVNVVHDAGGIGCRVCRVAAEIVFAGGERVLVPSIHVNTLMETLAVDGPREQRRSGVNVRPGFVAIESDQGVLYVRPHQVAYVRDVEDESRPAAAQTIPAAQPQYSESEYG